MTDIPASPHDLPNFEAYALAQSMEIEPHYQCPCCPRVVPALDLRDMSILVLDLPRWVCTTCASGPLRRAHQAAFDLIRSLAPDWTAVRSRRNGLLAASDWRMMPDAGLTDGEVILWRDYRSRLRSLPSDFPHPDQVVWPEPPPSKGDFDNRSPTL